MAMLLIVQGSRTKCLEMVPALLEQMMTLDRFLYTVSLGDNFP